MTVYDSCEPHRFFPIHQEDGLEKLKKNWANFGQICKSGLNIPEDDIKNYLGEEIALYFVYLSLYTWWLVPAAILGVATFIYQEVMGNFDSRGAVLFYATVMIFWGTLFLEKFKRKQVSLAHSWGTLGIEDVEPDRPEFIEMCTKAGGKGKNEYTDDIEYSYPDSKRYCSIFLTWGLPIFLLMVALTGIVAIFWLRYWLEHEHGLGALAGILNGAFINIFNEVYKGLALYLTNLEPHRTDTEFNDGLITKVFLFQFINSYSSMYMVAFVKANAESLGITDYVGICKCTEFKIISGMTTLSGGITDDDCTDQDLNKPISCTCENPDCVFELAWLLLSIFGVQLFIGNFLEFVVPWVKQKLLLAAEEKGMTEEMKSKQLTQAEFEAKLEPYERIEIFDDYNEMILQLGYITLFSPAFPLVSLMGLCNNIVEIRSDANKLCTVYQRPKAMAVEDIGSWETVLEIMTYVSVATNCGIVWFLTSFGAQYSAQTRVWGFVISEHCFLIVKVFIAWAIPDVPDEVKKRIAAQNYLTAKAMGDESASKYDPSKDAFFK